MKRSGLQRKTPLKAKSGLKRKGMKRKPPARRSGSLASIAREVRITQGRQFREAARSQRACAACGRADRPWEAHHVVEKGHLKREGIGDLMHPDNALRLCEYPCHAQHTNAHKRLALSCLTDRNIAYAVILLGEQTAHNYLTRHYAGSDPRVDALLRNDG